VSAKGWFILACSVWGVLSLAAWGLYSARRKRFADRTGLDACQSIVGGARVGRVRVSTPLARLFFCSQFLHIEPIHPFIPLPVVRVKRQDVTAIQTRRVLGGIWLRMITSGSMRQQAIGFVVARSAAESLTHSLVSMGWPIDP
jgi:hypothetical protein